MLGDGIPRDLATVSKEERDLLRDAILKLNQVFYSPTGSRNDFPAGHVSYWFKQDEIHQSSHVHGCPAFLPWHREMCNRFEALLRTIDSRLSLHYWNWNLDPSNMPDGEGGTISLFDDQFMGNADGAVNGGAVGQPLLGAGFYDPAATNYRDDNSPVNLNRPTADPTTFSYPAPATGVHYNPADPPQTLSRAKPPGAPLWEVQAGQRMISSFMPHPGRTSGT
jgi:Common central domain of tyrosinase